MKKIGLQLYSIKELAERDFLGTIRMVSDIGYEGVEFAGFYNTPPDTLKKHMDDLGILPCGSHISMEELTSDFNRTLEYNLEIENPAIIVPYLPEEFRKDRDGWRKTAETMNVLHEKLHKSGIRLGYHNHDFEFFGSGQEYDYDFFASCLHPDILLEMDLFWVAYAGVDVREYVERYAERIEPVHIKDMGHNRTSTIIGEGSIDFESLIPLMRHTEWLVIEQEHFETSFEFAVEKGFRHLDTLRRTQT
ncbi:MAG: sugar phosphate isomerase/epimerase [Clostridia bacterium]